MAKSNFIIGFDRRKLERRYVERIRWVEGSTM